MVYSFSGVDEPRQAENNGLEKCPLCEYGIQYGSETPVALLSVLIGTRELAKKGVFVVRMRKKWGKRYCEKNILV